MSDQDWPLEEEPGKSDPSIVPAGPELPTYADFAPVQEVDGEPESRVIPQKSIEASRGRASSVRGEPIETIEYKVKNGHYVLDECGNLIETKKISRKLRKLRRSLPGWGDASQ